MHEIELDRPAILQMDARVWLSEASGAERRPVGLGTVSGTELDRIADLGYRWLWLEGVWEPGRESREIWRRDASALERFREILPDLELEDIDASPWSVAAYRAREDLGGDDGLDALRTDLASRGLGLLLDFWTDRVALDHAWARERPELVAAERGPPAPGVGGRREDFLRLDVRHPALGPALASELEAALSRADGVCLRRGGADLDVGPPDAAAPGFLAGAESLVASRFPGTLLLLDGVAPGPAPGAPGSSVLALDRRLEAVLGAGDAEAARAHLATARATPSLGFLGARSGASADGCAQRMQASALLACFLSDGAVLRDGRLEGRRRAGDPRLRRRPPETADRDVESFCQTVLEILGRPEVRHGERVLLPVRAAWEGNETWRTFFATLFRHGSRRLLAIVNFGPLAAQCYVDLSPIEPAGGGWLFQDLLSLAVYPRHGDDLRDRGLYIDLPAWDYNVFEVARAAG